MESVSPPLQEAEEDQAEAPSQDFRVRIDSFCCGSRGIFNRAKHESAKGQKLCSRGDKVSKVTFTVNQDVTEEDPKTTSGSAESRRRIQSVSAPASTLM